MAKHTPLSKKGFKKADKNTVKIRRAGQNVKRPENLKVGMAKRRKARGNR